MASTTPQHPERSTESDADRDSDVAQAGATSHTQRYAVAQEIPAGAETAYQSPPEPTRPSGISWATVVLGLVAIVVGGLVLAFQLVDLTVDWSIAAPAAFVVAGGLLVLLGAAALVPPRTRRKPAETPDGAALRSGASSAPPGQ